MAGRSAKKKWSKEVGQIESICETKGVEIDELEVRESETEDGDDIVAFRVYSEDGPKTQITKMPSVQTGEMKFRDDVQNKISALKRAISNEDGIPEPEDDRDDEEDGEQSDETQQQSSRTRTRDRPEPIGDGPGSQIDKEIHEIHVKLEELEDRIEELEDKSEALDGLQQLMQGGNDD